MTDDRAAKKAARQRMAATGEPYSVARRAAGKRQQPAGTELIAEHGDPEMDYLVAERNDLVERIAHGDGLALAEVIEHTTGAKARAVRVTLPRPS